MLCPLFEQGEGDNVVDYSCCATFAIDDESVNPRDRLSIFDNSSRVWLDGKLFYSKVLQDWLNDDRSLPVVIAADKTANSCADA